MSKINLNETAKALPHAWKSSIVGATGAGNFKVLRMDKTPYPDEQHDFSEALLVLEGQLNLSIDNSVVCVQAGEVFIVPSGVPHAVAAGSHGTLVIIDK